MTARLQVLWGLPLAVVGALMLRAPLEAKANLPRCDGAEGAAMAADDTTEAQPRQIAQAL